MSDPAPILGAWHSHLTNARRRSEHTVRAYVGAARRLVAARGLETFEEVAALEAHDLRAHLAARRPSSC